MSGVSLVAALHAWAARRCVSAARTCASRRATAASTKRSSRCTTRSARSSASRGLTAGRTSEVPGRHRVARPPVPAAARTAAPASRRKPERPWKGETGSRTFQAFPSARSVAGSSSCSPGKDPLRSPGGRRALGVSSVSKGSVRAAVVGETYRAGARGAPPSDRRGAGFAPARYGGAARSGAGAMSAVFSGAADMPVTSDTNASTASAAPKS